MAGKGEKYAQVSVDLQRWLKDFRRVNNLNQAQVAAMILDENGKPVDKSRISAMKRGKQNTMLYLQRIGKHIYKGDFSCMVQYAMDNDGIETLAMLQFKSKLGPSERKITDRISTGIRKAVAEKDMKKLKAILKVVEN